MIERTGFVPPITFSADADYDTLFSLLMDWTVEVVMDDDTYYQGVIRHRDHCFLVWEPESDTELIVLDVDELMRVKEVVVL